MFLPLFDVFCDLLGSLDTTTISNHRYPGCQRLFMRGFRFRSSLKKVTREKFFLAASPLVSSAEAEDVSACGKLILDDIDFIGQSIKIDTHTPTKC